MSDFFHYYRIDLKGLLDLGWRQFITLLMGLGSECRWQQWRVQKNREERELGTGGHLAKGWAQFDALMDTMVVG